MDNPKCTHIAQKPSGGGQNAHRLLQMLLHFLLIGKVQRHRGNSIAGHGHPIKASTLAHNLSSTIGTSYNGWLVVVRRFFSVCSFGSLGIFLLEALWDKCWKRDRGPCWRPPGCFWVARGVHRWVGPYRYIVGGLIKAFRHTPRASCDTFELG